MISKVFEKNYGGKKIQGMSHEEYENEVEIGSSNLPPLKDISSSKREKIFDAYQEHKPKNIDLDQGFNKSNEFMPSINNIPLWFPNTQTVQNNEYLQYHDPSILRFLADNDSRLNISQNQRIELSH